MRSRVLVYRQGSLGDTVVALPCFHLIRAAFPDSEVRVLTNAPVADRAPPLFAVLEGSGLIDGYFDYPVSFRDRAGLWRLASAIKAWGPRTGIYLVNRPSTARVLRDAAFLWACGIRKFIGLPLTREMREPRRRPDGLVEREAERLARCLASLGAVDVADPANWNLGLTEAERAVPRRIVGGWLEGRPYIVVCVGTKQSANDWGLRNWRLLVRMLLSNYLHRIVLIGSAEDHAASQAIAGDHPGRCINLCGELEVRESAATIAAAALFIGVDSGPMHLAAAVGTPLVGIFSRLNSPGLWYPLSRGSSMLYPDAPGATIASITPAQVSAAAAALLPIDRISVYAQ